MQASSIELKAKKSHYGLDGTGRDSYIVFNNGGNYRGYVPEGVGKFERGAFHTPRGKRINSNYVPISGKPRHYIGDGSGRDCYIMYQLTDVDPTKVAGLLAMAATTTSSRLFVCRYNVSKFQRVIFTRRVRTTCEQNQRGFLKDNENLTDDCRAIATTKTLISTCAQLSAVRCVPSDLLRFL